VQYYEILNLNVMFLIEEPSLEKKKYLILF